MSERNILHQFALAVHSVFLLVILGPIDDQEVGRVQELDILLLCVQLPALAWAPFCSYTQNKYYFSRQVKKC